MSKDNVKEYLSFLWEANRPLYLHEMYEVMEELMKIEKKLTLREMTDVKFMTDTDLCRRYHLEPKIINPKYVDCVIDEDMRKVEEKVGGIIVVSNYNIIREYEKTDFATMRNGIVKQVISKGNELRRLDNDRFEKIMNDFGA